MIRQQAAATVFGLLLASYAYFLPQPGNYNVNSRVALTRALVERGTFSIDAYHRLPDMETHDESVFAGRYYSDKAPGASLLGAVVYAPVYWLARSLHREVPSAAVTWLVGVGAVGVPVAAALAVLFAFADSRAGRKRALLVTLATGLGTPLFPLSTVFMGHALGAALLWLAFVVIATRGGEARPGASALAGFLLGFCLITEFQSVLLVAPLCVCALWQMRGQPALRTAMLAAALAAGAAVPLAFYMYYNAACFGSPFANAYTYFARDDVRAHIHTGIMGIGKPSVKNLYYLTLHPVRGLFIQSPVALLALPGLAFLWRAPGRRAKAALATWALISVPIVLSGFYDWAGGASATPRALLPMIPFLALPLLALPREWDGVLGILALISIAQMLALTAYAPFSGSFLIRLQEEAHPGGWIPWINGSPVAESVRWLLRGHWRDTIGSRLLPLSGAPALLPLAAVLAAGGYWIGRNEER